eukprot:gb/GECG01004240.1/.p1 GENE.gb/GECG01004240.1/~~gb/GECG01004240.1/.p1  ORF type:complete len:269 (+),score=48.97 gb/GECG01004240.1/:1-807(+)
MSSSELHKAQQRVREDAMEMSSALSEVRQWEQSIRQKDKDIREQRQHHHSGEENQQERRKDKVVLKADNASKPKNAHVYDQGYAYWDKFDVDKALEETEEADQDGTEALSTRYGRIQHTEEVDVSQLSQSESVVDVERERGNKHFRDGAFQRAVDAYTRGLAEQPNNVTLLSNRAMAFIKIKLYENAIEDANQALEIQPDHNKSLLRRAKALSNLGRLRDALVDLAHALSLDPSNKHVRSEMRKIQELRNSSIHKAPFTAAAGTIAVE